MVQRYISLDISFWQQIPNRYLASIHEKLYPLNGPNGGRTPRIASIITSRQTGPHMVVKLLFSYDQGEIKYRDILHRHCLSYWQGIAPIELGLYIILE